MNDRYIPLIVITAIAVGLSVYTHNYHFLWLLALLIFFY
jgi:hypothetical protein